MQTRINHWKRIVCSIWKGIISMGENEHLDNLPLDSAGNENMDKVITISDIIGEKAEAEEKTEDIKEEQLPQPAAGMKEIRLEDVDSSKVKYIDNPLPVPKRREHREMDYLINVRDDDDYDITDMTGMDYFDII